MTMLRISTWLSGKPTQTEVVYWGMNPTNHTSVWSWWVPVLPACGRPM